MSPRSSRAGKTTAAAVATLACAAALLQPSTALAAPAAAADEPTASRFTYAVLPDTQFYARYADDQFAPRYGTNPFAVQTKWLAEHADELNVPFVSHLGDIVDRAGQQKEWQAADAAMANLENADVPYSILPGNHDVLNEGVDDVDADLANEPFLRWFGETRRANVATHEGSDPTGMSQYHVFEAEGQQFLVLALTWRAGDATLEWANDVIDAHPTLPVILTTHQLLNVQPDQTSPLETAYGLRLWDKLIKGNDQIFLTLNGHYHGAARLDKTNDFGHTVTQIVIDYQMAYEGGNGYLGLFEFDLTNGLIDVITGSPWVVSKPRETLTSYDQAMLENPQQQYTLNVDFEERFGGFNPDFGPGTADETDLTEKARGILLDGFEGPEAPNLQQPGSRDDYVQVDGTVAHWRFGNRTGVLREGQVVDDIAGDADLHRVSIAESGSTGAQVGDVTLVDDVNPYSADGGAVCFANSDQRATANRFSYLESARNVPATETRLENGYTLETFIKVGADFTAEKNAWSKAIVRSGNRSKMPGMPWSRWDYTASPAALGVSNLREFQWTEVPVQTSKGDRTAWSGEIILDRWVHVALVNDPATSRTTMYLDGAPVLRNATDTLGQSIIDGAPWIFGADWVDDQAKNGWNGCIGETRLIDHPTDASQWLTARAPLGVVEVTEAPATPVAVGSRRLVFEGTGTPGAAVSLSGAVEATGEVTADGTWRLVASGAELAAGEYTVEVRQGFGERLSEAVKVPLVVAGPAPERTATVALLKADEVRYGTAATVSVRVSGGDTAPTGDVAVLAGDEQLATATLANGRATVTLPKTALAPGTHPLTVRYLGDSAHAASTDTVELTVSKATTSTRLTVADASIRWNQRVKLTVAVSSAAATTGTITVKDGSRTVVTKVELKDGRATITLPRLTVGKHRIGVTYTGSDLTESSKSTVKTVIVSR